MVRQCRRRERREERSGEKRRKVGGEREDGVQ